MLENGWLDFWTTFSSSKWGWRLLCGGVNGRCPWKWGLHQVLDYVLEHFVLPTCNYPPSTWAATPDAVGKRTNNGTESFHSHFNAQFYARHPKIIMFLEVIKQIQCITYIKLSSLKNENLIRRSEMEKLTFARDQYQKYTSATQTRRDYIASMGYKFSARTDLWI